MSAALTAIQNNYIQNFPSEVPTKAAQGFIATAVINLLAGSASNVALIGGAFAVTATIIEAVARPIIKAVFPRNPGIVIIIQIVMPRMMALGLAASLAPWLGVAYKMSSILMSSLAWLALNNRFLERNVGMVEVL